jgi:hypothetical protein
LRVKYDFWLRCSFLYTWNKEDWNMMNIRHLHCEKRFIETVLSSSLARSSMCSFRFFLSLVVFNFVFVENINSLPDDFSFILPLHQKIVSHQIQEPLCWDMKPENKR